jgi:polyribonucleotide nucleotidyltransferase
MTRARNLSGGWPGKYLTAADLAGKTLTATVSKIDYENMQDGTEKPVAHFTELGKAVVLNKSRGKVLADIAESPDFDDWIGVKVQIRAGLTAFKGDEVRCIKFERTSEQKTKKVKEALKGDDLPEDKIPF